MAEAFTDPRTSTKPQIVSQPLVTPPYPVAKPTPTPPATPPAGPTIVDVGSLYPPAQAINKAAAPTEVTAQAVSAVDQIIPVLYGYPHYLGVRYAGVVADTAGNLHLLGVLGYGELGHIDQAYIDAAPLPMSGPNGTASYYGTPTQTVDATIQAAYAQRGVSYTDAMPGIAYVRLTLTPDMSLQNLPNISVTCGGKKIVDVRNGFLASFAGLNNPVLCLADFIQSPVYGLGASYDVASFSAAADFCDEVVSGKPRYTMALALTAAQKVADWLAQIVAYTGCALWRRGGVYYLTPLRPRITSLAITKRDIIEGSFDMQLRAQRELPTHVTVSYTDWSTIPPSSRTVTQPDNAVDDGRESTLQLPGVIDFAQAARIAARRMNQIWYGQLTATWRAFDAALTYRQGDVLSLAFPDYGLASPLFSITSLTDQGFGRWSVSAESYNAAAFTDVVVQPPSILDPGDLVPPATGAPILPGPVTMVEELVQFGSGDYRPRLRIDWPDAGDPTAMSHYGLALFDVTDAAHPQMVESSNVPLSQYISNAVDEGRIYRAYVTAVGLNGLSSPAIISLDQLVLGKTANPSSVENFAAVEAGGNVYCSWSAIPDLDRDEYEIRRGGVGAAWDAMVPVSKLHSTNTVLNSQPMGTVDYAIKARDTTGHYSTTEARQTVTVTQDQNLNITGPNPFIGYTTSNCVVWPSGATAIMMNTNLAGMWGDGADNPDDAVGTFNDNLKDTYIAIPANAPAWMQTNPYDFTVAINTRVSCFVPWWLWGGPSSGVTMTIETSLDNVTYTPITETELRSVRYVRCRLNIAPGTCIQSTQQWSVSLVSILVTEQGNVTTDASGKATVNLSSRYATWVAIQTTPQGNVAGVTSTFDNVIVGTAVLNSFDVWIFKANAPAAGTASWSFRGVR